MMEKSEENRHAVAIRIRVIRALGFVGNMHYCGDCMNEFHADRGQHKPGCSVLASILEDEEWWDDI